MQCLSSWGLVRLCLAVLAATTLLDGSTVWDLTLGGAGGANGNTNSTAVAINDNGEVTGYSFITGSTSSYHIYLYNPLDLAMPLADLEKNTSYASGFSNATGINLSGEITGFWLNGPYQALLYDG